MNVCISHDAESRSGWWEPLRVTCGRPDAMLLLHPDATVGRPVWVALAPGRLWQTMLTKTGICSFMRSRIGYTLAGEHGAPVRLTNSAALRIGVRWHASRKG
jgi:hypothetical protein